MNIQNLGGAVVEAMIFTALLHLVLRLKSLSNPLSTYSLLLSEGVNKGNRESKSLKKDDLVIFRNFGKFYFHPFTAPSPLHPGLKMPRKPILGLPI